MQKILFSDFSSNKKNVLYLNIHIYLYDSVFIANLTRNMMPIDKSVILFYNSAHIKLIYKILPFLLIIFFNFSSGQSVAQQKAVIDSLENVLLTVPIDTTRVNTLNEISYQLWRNKQYEKALVYSNDALLLAKELNFKKGAGIAYRYIGTSKHFLGQYDEALINADSGLDIGIEIGDVRISGHCYNLKGMVYSRQGDYEASLENYFLALNIWEEIGYKKGSSNAYGNLAGVYEALEDYPQAIKYDLSSLKIAEEQGDRVSMASRLLSLGRIYELTGNIPLAIEYSQKALKLQKEIGNKDNIALTYNNIGVILANQREKDESLNYYESAMKLYTETGNQNGIALTRYNIGIVNLNLENYNSAFENLSESLKIYKELGDQKGIARSLNMLGGYYFTQSDFNLALEYHLESLKISEEIGCKSCLIAIFLDIGETYYKNTPADSVEISSDNYLLAYDYIQKALAISLEVHDLFDVRKAYYMLANIDSAQGNYLQALEHYKLFTQYRDSLINEENTKQITNLKIQYEIEKKDQEIELLNKDNRIKALQLEQQEASLLASKFEYEKNRNELQLLATMKEFQELQLVRTQEELDHQHLLSEAQAAEMELISKDKELKEQQLARQKLQRNGIIITMAFLILLGILLFRSQHLRKKLEKQSAIIQERKRISADLHDDIGTGLSKISLLSELVRNQAKTPEAKKEAEKIADTSKELLQSIGEIIWALNANNDHLENLVAYIRRYASEYFENSDLKLKISSPVNIPQTPVSGESRRNIFFAVKEALHNIVKHAQATMAEINVSFQNRELSVVIKDNGTGLPEGELNRFGNGMKSMKNRMEKINGKFSAENDCGTKITLSIPL